MQKNCPTGKMWCWSLAALFVLALGAVQAADRQKAEGYVRMARVAEADQDWLRSLALYNLAQREDPQLDGVGARRQYVIDKALEAKLDPQDAAKIPDPTVRKPSEKEVKTDQLVTDAQKAERAGNWKLAMDKYNEAAAYNPMNFYLISRAKSAAAKAGVPLPPLPKVAGLADAPPPTEVPAGPAPVESPTTTPVAVEAPAPTTTPAPAPTVEKPQPKTPTPKPLAKPVEPELTEAELAQKMIEQLVLKRVQAAFAEPLADRIKALNEMDDEFGSMTDEDQKSKMQKLLQRTIFTQAVGRLSSLERPEYFGIENKIDTKNTYFYTPGGETYKLVLKSGKNTNSAFITFRVGIVPGSSPAVSTAKLDSPEGKKIIEHERAELEEWRKNQKLTTRIMQGKGSYFNQKTEIFTLDNPSYQATVNSYIVEEGGVLMIYRTYSKRNPELDRALKKIVGKAQSGGFDK